MDVKDIQKPKATAEGQPPRTDAKNLQRAASTLSSSRKVSDPVDLKVEKRGPASENSSLRARMNQAISAVNMAIETTTELEKLVRSIGGIVAQASGVDLPDRRRSVLEKEAGELASKVQEITDIFAQHGTQPAVDNDIKREIEGRLGRTLDSIFPKEVVSGFGLGAIALSPRENIVKTLANVAAARDRIEHLSESVRETRDAVKSVVSALEVAVQNTEASEASVRDVEQAANLASKTRISISYNPEGALNSVGSLGNSVLGLLK